MAGVMILAIVAGAIGGLLLAYLEERREDARERRERWEEARVIVGAWLESAVGEREG